MPFYTIEDSFAVSVLETLNKFGMKNERKHEFDIKNTKIFANTAVTRVKILTSQDKRNFIVFSGFDDKPYIDNSESYKSDKPILGFISSFDEVYASLGLNRRDEEKFTWEKPLLEIHNHFRRISEQIFSQSSRTLIASVYSSPIDNKIIRYW